MGDGTPRPAGWGLAYSNLLVDLRKVRHLAYKKNIPAALMAMDDVMHTLDALAALGTEPVTTDGGEQA
jgi:hypothetical protein